MDFSKFTFRQIDAETQIKSFDCGDADLNDFLFSDAVNYYRSMMALTYLLEDNEADKTVAYYSLLNDKIVFDPGALFSSEHNQTFRTEGSVAKLEIDPENIGRYNRYSDYIEYIIQKFDPKIGGLVSFRT